MNDFKLKGQDDLMVQYHFKNYSAHFQNVYVFSYAKEKAVFFDNVHVLPNRFELPRFLYALTLPFFYQKELKNCNILRAFQITGAIPAFISKLFFAKPYVFNYGYNYAAFARLEKKQIRALLLRFLIYPLGLFADQIIITAEYLLNSLPRRFQKKIILIPNGVDTHLFSPRAEKNSNKQIILSVGRLEAQKNFLSLIKAIKLFNKKTVKLQLIGSGSQRDMLIHYAQELSIPLSIVSRVKHSKLPDYFAKADIFVLPSFIEGQPKALLEAMGCGLAVVASDIPAHREIIQNGKNGLICGTEPQQIAKSVERLISDPKLRREIGQNARTTIETYYDKQKLNIEEITLLKKAAAHSE